MGRRTSDPTCDQCRFWHGEDDESAGGPIFGTCRRRSPELSADAGLLSERSRWPTTWAHDWCGEGDWGDRP